MPQPDSVAPLEAPDEPPIAVDSQIDVELSSQIEADGKPLALLVVVEAGIGLPPPVPPAEPPLLTPELASTLVEAHSSVELEAQVDKGPPPPVPLAVAVLEAKSVVLAT